MGKDILLLLVKKYLKYKEHSRLAKLLQSEKHLENEIAIKKVFVRIMSISTFTLLASYP
jgi:hypothetical protein